MKADVEIWHARGNGSCMFHSILNDNNPRAAYKLRCILADFVREQWDFQMPGLGMSVRELIGGSGLSKEGYLKNIVQPSYWGSEIELYLLSWLLNQTFQVYLEAGNYWQLCRSYGSGKPIMRLLYHDSHYDLIRLKKRTQSTEEAKETSSSENWEEG